MQLDKIYHLAFANFHFCIYPFSVSAQTTIERLCAHFDAFSRVGDNNRLCNVIIVSLEKEGLMLPQVFPDYKSEQWVEFCKASNIAYRRFFQAKSLQRQITERSDIFTFNWHPKDTSEVCLVGLLETKNENSYLQVFNCLLLLATRWHVQHGGLLIHSTGIARGSDGFLFLGESGAGKTTVARQSVLNDYKALGDDLNFIIPGEENSYILLATPSPVCSPVGYFRGRPLLRGIFNLVQDQRDFLIPIAPIQTAQILVNGFFQAPKTYYMSDSEVRLLFKTSCDIARRIPSYELHFRKSPDFWKLIDERFPD